ncbi:DUF2262 domain-containing protein [Bradyrhizobium sp. HKCCYLS1011]|uniref:DUF2262 domain-containing protein n=1 Tax=Bradyrhizobium sp. HKCCYLS1011 TaxID=3420733 RepID=UPI003EB8B38F
MVDGPKNLVELLAQLKHREITDIVGVVGPLGAWGSEIPGRTHNLMFTLEPWRYEGGAIQDRKLTIRGAVSEATRRSSLMRVKAFDVVRIRAQVADENAFGTPQGELVDIVAVMYDGDADLTSRAEALGRPVRVNDDRFGLFTLDRRVNWFETTATWISNEVVLRLSMSGCDNVERLIALAHALWNSQAKWDQAVRACAVTSLLDLKNENWLADDEEEVTAEEFFDRITPQGIVLYQTGRFEFSCHDDDMFGGHDIEVIGNLFDGAHSADIQ